MIESRHIKHVLEHKSVLVARNNEVININEELKERDVLLSEPSVLNKYIKKSPNEPLEVIAGMVEADLHINPMLYIYLEDTKQHELAHKFQQTSAIE